MQDEDGNVLPKDDMTPYTPKQKYVFLKMVNQDPEKQKEHEAVVATKDKDVLRAYINSQVGKNATYAWTVAAAPATASLARTVVSESKVGGLLPSAQF